MSYDVRCKLHAPNRGNDGPMYKSWTVYNKFESHACFGSFAGTAGDKDVLGIVYKPNWNKADGLSEAETREFYGLLLEEFNFKDYLDGYPTVDSMMEHGAHISTELPTGNIMYLLTTLRYVDEYAFVVKTYLQIRRIGDLTESQYFDWAHKICNINSPYGVPTGHSLLSGQFSSWTDGELNDLFLKDWDKNEPHRVGGRRTMLENVYRNKRISINGTQLGKLSGRNKYNISDFERIDMFREGIEGLSKILGKNKVVPEVSTEVIQPPAPPRPDRGTIVKNRAQKLADNMRRQDELLRDFKQAAANNEKQKLIRGQQGFNPRPERKAVKGQGVMNNKAFYVAGDLHIPRGGGF